MKCKFSFIVPVYNIENYIEKCIQSIITQTVDSFELILVDDGSTDRSPSICDEYASKNKHIYVIHKENGGQASARQAGYIAASGEYICFVDGDDWISDRYLEIVLQAINQHNPDILCFGYYESWCDRNIEMKLGYHKGYYTRDNMIADIFPSLVSGLGGKIFIPSLCNKVFRRDLYARQSAFDHRVAMGEDAACSIPAVFAAESLYICDECLYYYRQNPTSISHSKKPYAWDGPMLRGQHLEKNMDMDFLNFRLQTDWHILYALYTVVLSQFRDERLYWTVRREIIEHLREPYYKTVIKRCNFRKNLKDCFILFVLKFKLIGLIKMHYSWQNR